LPAIDVEYVLISFTVLLFSLTVHEFAHAWTADRLGDPTARRLGRVSLNPIVHADPIGTVLFPLLAMVGNVPLIGWAKPVPVDISRLPHHRRDFMVIAAAGPASNLVMAFLASGALLWMSPAGMVGSVLYLAARLNILLAVFNMLPIPPLDGGNVLSGLLPRGLALKFDQIRPYGFILLYALILTDGYRYLVVPPSNFLRTLMQLP
jgi:Zn-dependent protease